uniref:Heat shock protein 70 n=1 Tax=Panagrolaimus davidi TaxID=227884 RepID=A0A914PRB9_9BILA
MPAIVIDLGTSKCCVGFMKDDGTIDFIENNMSCRTKITPSYIGFNNSHNERVFGYSALQYSAENPAQVVYDVKRLIGRQFSDPSVQNDIKYLPFNIIMDQKNRIMVEVEFKNEKQSFYPEQLSAMLLSHLKEAVASKLACTGIMDAVITVPAYFSYTQRQATKLAAEIAGLNVLRILNEPSAAALCYGFLKNFEKEKKILIFNLGGGFFDVSILEIEDGAYQVKAVNGDTHFGGADFDNLLVDYFAKKFFDQHQLDIKSDSVALQSLKIAAENAKKKFEKNCEPLFSKFYGPIDKVLYDAEMHDSDIDEIVLVGGSTRIKKIRGLLLKRFNGKNLDQSVNPDEAVAFGATVQAAILSKKLKDIVLIDGCSLSRVFLPEEIQEMKEVEKNFKN